MNDFRTGVNEFNTLIEKYFAFLQDHGFRRSPKDEHTSPTGCTVVFLGKNVGITISFDIRDNQVDAQVVRVINGVLKRNWEGGYSRDLYLHLVKHEGYRGRPSGPGKDGQTSDDKSRLAQMVWGWANLLTTAGKKILEDTPDSLPR